MADIDTRNRRLTLMRRRPHTDTPPLRPHTDTLGLRDTHTRRRRREWATTTSIISGMIATGGFKTIVCGCSNIIRTGLHRESKVTTTTITNTRFHG